MEKAVLLNIYYKQIIEKFASGNRRFLQVVLEIWIFNLFQPSLVQPYTLRTSENLMVFREYGDASMGYNQLNQKIIAFPKKFFQVSFLQIYRFICLFIYLFLLLFILLHSKLKKQLFFDLELNANCSMLSVCS